MFIQVTYSAVDFLEKNRDTLSSNMQSLMENSKNNLVNELFLAKVLDTGTLDMRFVNINNNSWHYTRHEQFTHSISLAVTWMFFIPVFIIPCEEQNEKKLRKLSCPVIKSVNLIWLTWIWVLIGVSLCDKFIDISEMFLK